MSSWSMKDIMHNMTRLVGFTLDKEASLLAIKGTATENTEL